MVNNKSVTVPIAVIHSSPTLSQNTEKRDPKKILETPKVKKIPKIGTLLGTVVEMSVSWRRQFLAFLSLITGAGTSLYFYLEMCDQNVLTIWTSILYFVL